MLNDSVDSKRKCGPIDHCSCSKPDGHWGNHGWHWRRIVEIDVPESLPPEHYVGAAVAYERCPHFEAVVEQAANDNRKLEETQRKKKLPKF